MKVSRKYHIRRKGAGRGIIRKNPSIKRGRRCPECGGNIAYEFTSDRWECDRCNYSNLFKSKGVANSFPCRKCGQVWSEDIF